MAIGRDHRFLEINAMDGYRYKVRGVRDEDEREGRT